jgi:hypothetical protein
MSPFSLTDPAKIIGRDSKDPTYKFALLRGWPAKNSSRKKNMATTANVP